MASYYDQYNALTQGQPAAAPSPFVWGAGGEQLTPDDIARKRQMAQALMQSGMDYSPVGSWTQGAARVAQALMGAIDEKSADKEAASNAAANQAITQSLLGGSGDKSSAALTALTSPYATEGTREAGKLAFQAANRQPQALPDIIQLAQIANDPGQPEWARSAAAGRVEALNNPVITMPGGGLALRSDVTGALQKGGDLPSGTGPGASPAAPPQEAIDALLRGEGTDAQFDQMFGTGAASQARGAVSSSGASPTVISPADAAPFLKSLGQAGFNSWLAKHNVKVAQ